MKKGDNNLLVPNYNQLKFRNEFLSLEENKKDFKGFNEQQSLKIRAAFKESLLKEDVDFIEV